jgi:hypothetical protein
MGLLLCIVVIWQRNRVRLSEAQERFEEHAAGLIEKVQTTGTLPLFYPPRQSARRRAAASDFTYIDDAMVRFARSWQGPLIVAYSPSVRFVLGPDERVVAMREAEGIRVTTMSNRQFRQRLAEQRRRAEEALERVRQSGPRLP